MKYILDSSFFFGEYSFDGEYFTTPEVVEELKDITSRMRFEVCVSNGLCVSEAEADDLLLVTKAALASGDARVLSDTDLSVVALALSLAGSVVSDDFAVQNVCRHLKVPFCSMMQKRAKKRVWKKICSGCGAVIPENEVDCPICGSAPIKRGSEKPRKK